MAQLLGQFLDLRDDLFSFNFYVFVPTDTNPKPDKPAVNPPKSGGGGYLLLVLLYFPCATLNVVCVCAWMFECMPTFDIS